MPNEDFPLRVDGVTAGWAAERRPEDVIPAARTDAWQLVYVRSGTIEERCDDRRVLLRAGGLLFHQPAETFGMRPVGEVPPDVLRLDFLCTQAGMDRFRGAVFHAEPQLRKNNGTIPGIRPGKPTSDFITKTLSKITLIGAIFLAIVAGLPIILGNITGTSIQLGGTSLLIVVGVALETGRSLEGYMTARHHKGFLE